MELKPINKTRGENDETINEPLCKDFLVIAIDLYKKVGFIPPWICYYVIQDNNIVGVAGFKSPPKNGTVEITYGTCREYQGQGVGTAICKELVNISLQTDSSIRITARTLPEKNHSTRILEKNHFIFIGNVEDSDDGIVWEWKYRR